MKKLRLDEIDKKTPFEVPEDYFQKLTADIQSRVAEKPRRRWITTPQLQWAVSGALVILVTLTIVFFPKEETLTAEQLLAQVDDQELINYLETIELTDADLATTLDDENLDGLLFDSFEEIELGGEDLDELLIDYEYELDNLL